MRRFTISTLSSRQAAFRRHLKGGQAFSGDSADQHGGRKIAWLINTFMSNPPDSTPISYKGEERDAIRMEVISREHIKPSSPTPQNLRYYKLSMFDQIEVPIYHPFMFFYLNDNKDNENIEKVIMERSKHLKQTLSETLTRMYPFAGKLASELHIDCNDDGVYYVETRVHDRLNNVLTKPDNKFLKRLIPVIDSVPNQPLLGCYVSMVQVNFFNCGGVSITLQHNHKLADGRSSMIFINTWAAIARQDPNQIYPNFVSSSMFPQNPRLQFSPYIPLWYLTISPAYIKSGKCETKRFVFDSLALRKLKAEASKHQPVSRVVAVLAFLWKCVTFETQSKPSAVHVPVDIRHRFAPHLTEHSIGNVKSGAFVRFDPGVCDLEVASMAGQLKKEIEDCKGGSIEELKGQNGHDRLVEGLRNSMEMFTDFAKEYYLTSSLCNSGTKEADFGWGKPVWFCTGNHLNEDVPLFTNRMVLMDSCSGDGMEAWVTLEKQVMDAVECNAELLSFASVDPTPL